MGQLSAATECVVVTGVDAVALYRWFRLRCRAGVRVMVIRTDHTTWRKCTCAFEVAKPPAALAL